MQDEKVRINKKNTEIKLFHDTIQKKLIAVKEEIKDGMEGK